AFWNRTMQPCRQRGPGCLSTAAPQATGRQLDQGQEVSDRVRQSARVAVRPPLFEQLAQARDGLRLPLEERTTCIDQLPFVDSGNEPSKRAAGPSALRAPPAPLGPAAAPPGPS